jgi:beta-glucanase (GH16 family)
MPLLIDQFNTPADLAGYLADGWANGGVFANVWSASQYTYRDGVLDISLAQQGDQYQSGAYLSLETYGYGRLEARLKAAAGSGIVNGLFTYTGSPHDEIDIEILGQDTTRAQFNYFVNGQGGHEHVVELGFDAAQDYHVYAFEWSADSIRWFVDGVERHAVSSAVLPVTPGKAMANLWNSLVLNDWAGRFDADALPATLSLDWIRYLPQGETAPASLEAERIFDWAEQLLPELLPEHAATQSIAGYQARLYTNGNALGEQDGTLYWYAPEQGLMLLGQVDQFLPQAESMGF